MIKEKSCGAVVYKVVDNQVYFLIEKMKKGHFSIPKGHVENKETEVQTALREIKEETNLDVIIDTSFKEIVSYSPYEGCIKDVVFFAALVNSEKVINQECEVSDIYFYKFDKAYKTLTYKSDKETLLKAYVHILLNLMKKCILIGSPGSGKSYLTKHLKEVIDLPVYHLDRIYWYGNWQHISKEEFVEKQEQIMRNDKWLIDGDYNATIENRIKNADTIIRFNLPTSTCIKGVKHRIDNQHLREDITPSCIEKEFDPEFESYIINFKKNKNQRTLDFMKRYPCNVLTITSKKQLDTIISFLKTKKVGK